MAFEVLDALTQHNQWADANNLPNERIEIDVLTGASAGGMTVAMIAQRLSYDGPAMSQAYNNPLYNAWVRDIDITCLLDRGPDEPATHSVLSSNCVMFAIGVWLYASATRARDRVGRWAFIAYVALLLLIYIGDRFSGPPPGPAAITWTGIIAMFILIPWAWWFDHHRVAR